MKLSLENETEIFIPPILSAPISLPDGVVLEGKLRSTRGGANFNWSANAGARSLFSLAPFEPYLRVRLWGDVQLTSLGWHTRCEAQIAEGDGEFPDFRLSWGGSMVDSPATITAHCGFDLTRRVERRELIDKWSLPERRDQHCPILEQGHLSLACVDLAEIPENLDGDITLLRHPIRPVILYNHAVFVDSVLTADFRRLIFTGGVERMVTSPDHLLEPVTLPARSWWLLSHPQPVNGND